MEKSFDTIETTFSSDTANANNESDGDFRQAFGEHTGIRERMRQEINQIKNNDPKCKRLYLLNTDAEHFSDQAWGLLGGYIATNHHLEELGLCYIDLTDENMPKLFKHLTGSTSLKEMCLDRNGFGLNGIQSMVPFLKNSSLANLSIGENANINMECFRLLINALRGGSIETLYASSCGIEDSAALEDCSLPNLKELDLALNNIEIIPALEDGALPHLTMLHLHMNSIETISSLEKYTNLEELSLGVNSIGMEGCKSVAKLLQNPSSKLMHLDLESNDFGDKEAEILADSLKHNTTLRTLSLEGNERIEEDGRRAFLKLLSDVSSVGSTYSSNHSLTGLQLPSSDGTEAAELNVYIDWVVRINEEKEDEGNSEEWAGRRKVIALQLDSDKRMILCRLQRIDYCYNSLFANSDPLLLPEILSIVGEEHGQTELYRMLIASVADLSSIANKS